MVVGPLLGKLNFSQFGGDHPYLVRYVYIYICVICLGGRGVVWKNDSTQNTHPSVVVSEGSGPQKNARSPHSQSQITELPTGRLPNSPPPPPHPVRYEPLSNMNRTFSPNWPFWNQPQKETQDLIICLFTCALSTMRMVFGRMKLKSSQRFLPSPYQTNEDTQKYGPRLSFCWPGSHSERSW